MWGLNEQEVGVQGFGNQRRNPLAELLMRQGSSNRPVEHWSQALANAASMIGGAYISRLDNEKADAATASAESKFEKSFGLVPHLLGTAGSTPSPAAFPDASQQPIQPAVFDAGKSDYSQAMTDAASRYGIDPSYLVRTAQIESGGNPNARNRSGATGLFQFMPATAKEYGVNPLDPVSSIDGAARYAANAKQHLTQALGREPTLGELYLAHQQGPGGAARLLSNPNTPAASLVGVKAVTQNNGQADMTAGEFAQKWTGKFGQGGGALPGVQQVAQAAPPAPQGGGMSPRVMGMMRALQNPYLTPQTRALGMMMLKTEMEKANRDPNDAVLKNLQIQQAQGALEAMPLDREGKVLSNAKAARDLNEMEYKTDNAGNSYERLKGSNQPFTRSKGLPDAAPQLSQEADARRQEAERLGLTPDEPAYKAFVLTGKMPREDAQPLSATDKKFILEADEGVLAAQTAIQSLQRAKELSAGASSLPLPNVVNRARAWFGNEAASNTVQMDNEITTNALSQLKSIFGGAPTEGERKLLLDIQGSSSLPHADRVKIFERAERLAQTRLKLNQDRSNELRGGTFYKPQAAQPSQTGTATAPLPASDPLGIR